MPVEIVPDNGGATSVEDGTIQVGDLNIMTQHYKKNVSLVPVPPGLYTIIKRFSFYFSKAQLLALFDQYEDNEDANAIEIALGVHVQGSNTECPGGSFRIDMSDSLAAIVSMTNLDTRDPLNEAGDYVLINGYKSANKFIEVALCCPGSKPPPPQT